MEAVAGTFVGRRAELDAAVGALAVDSGERPTSTVCIVGPAGIGKTRLVGEIEQTLAHAHPTTRVVWTRCWDGPGTPALWPWTQLLEQLGLPTTIGDLGGDRVAYFDRISSELRASSGHTPLVVVIDDVHWADQASLELLGFVARSPRPAQLSVIATYREPEVSSGSIAQQIARIEREATLVSLSGLSEQHVAELANAHRAEHLPPDLVAQLHERSDGNPFFVGELLHSLGDDPTVDSLPVTTGLRVAVENHLSLVSTSTRRLLELAAVQGRFFDPEVLAVASNVDEFAVAEMLNAAAERGIVDRDGTEGLDGDTGTRWRFDHALLGEVLLGGQSPHDVALHHLRTADGLEKIHGPAHPDHVEPIANHLLAAGSLTSPARLLDAALDAARHAGDRLAWEDESHHLATAMHALRSLGDPDPADVVSVAIQRIEVEKRRRRLDVAHELSLEAATWARSSADPTLLARVALAFPPDVEAIEIDDIYNPDQRPIRDEALEAISRSDGDDALRAQLQAALALSLYWETPTGDRAQSHQLSSERRDQLTADAIEIARRLDDDHTLAAALNARIYANWGPAMRAERPALAEELIEVAHRLGDPHLALSGRIWRVVELLETHRIAEADREIDAFEREAARIRSRLHLWTVARWRANRAFMRGELDLAEALAADALTQGVEIMPDDVAFHFFTTTLGPIQYLRCTIGESYEYIRDTAAASPNVPAWRVGLATILSQTGRHDQARRELAAIAADEFAVLPRDLNFVGTMMMCALVANDLGDREVAAMVYDHLAPYAGRLALHGTGYASYGAIDLALGQCAHVLGRDDAETHYRLAIEACDRLGSPYAAVSRFHLAQLRSRTDEAGAIDLLARAERDFRSHGLDAMAERCEVAAAAIVDRTAVRLAEGSDGWTLQRGEDAPHPLPRLKGFRALQALVGQPGHDVHALDLAAVLEGRDRGVPRAASTDEVADAQARRSYEVHIAELQSQLDDADRRGDVDRSARLADELDRVVAALAEATGFGGRAATIRDDADRARVNVTKHVKRAIERIAEVDTEVGAHLRDHVVTGMTCRYEPGADGPHWA